jgi:hypothetical protein
MLHVIEEDLSGIVKTNHFWESPVATVNGATTKAASRRAKVDIGVVGGDGR